MFKSVPKKSDIFAPEKTPNTSKMLRHFAALGHHFNSAESMINTIDFAIRKLPIDTQNWFKRMVEQGNIDDLSFAVRLIEFHAYQERLGECNDIKNIENTDDLCATIGNFLYSGTRRLRKRVAKTIAKFGLDVLYYEHTKSFIALVSSPSAINVVARQSSWCVKNPIHFSFYAEKYTLIYIKRPENAYLLSINKTLTDNKNVTLADLIENDCELRNEKNRPITFNDLSALIESFSRDEIRKSYLWLWLFMNRLELINLSNRDINPERLTLTISKLVSSLQEHRWVNCLANHAFLFFKGLTTMYEAEHWKLSASDTEILLSLTPELFPLIHKNVPVSMAQKVLEKHATRVLLKPQDRSDSALLYAIETISDCLWSMWRTYCPTDIFGVAERLSKCSPLERSRAVNTHKELVFYMGSASTFEEKILLCESTPSLGLKLFSRMHLADKMTLCNDFPALTEELSKSEGFMDIAINEIIKRPVSMFFLLPYLDRKTLDFLFVHHKESILNKLNLTEFDRLSGPVVSTITLSFESLSHPLKTKYANDLRWLYDDFTGALNRITKSKNRKAFIRILRALESIVQPPLF